MRVFVNTSAFFAHIVAEDKNHIHARLLFERSFAESWQLTTTNALVWETYTLIRKRARNSRELTLAFIDSIHEGICDVMRVENTDEMEAINLLRHHADKEYSFCDALSFVIMERNKVEHAMAFDRDFETYGRFTLL